MIAQKEMTEVSTGADSHDLKTNIYDEVAFSLGFIYDDQFYMEEDSEEDNIREKLFSLSENTKSPNPPHVKMTSNAVTASAPAVLVDKKDDYANSWSSYAFNAITLATKATSIALNSTVVAANSIGLKVPLKYLPESFTVQVSIKL